MADPRTALQVLESIDASLKQLVRLMAVAAPAKVADDKDLDGQYGDPEVKFDPRDWTGGSCKGFHFSECPAEFLDLIAETFDYFASQAEAKGETTTSGKPVAPYKRLDAARARGWAKRIRAGYKVPAQAAGDGWAEPTMPTEDEVPF